VGKVQRPFLRQVSLASLIDESAGNCQTAVAVESGTIRNSDEIAHVSEMVALCPQFHKDKVKTMYMELKLVFHPKET
jgi:hypothetical protein